MKLIGENFRPIIARSTKWLNWISLISLFTCKYCRKCNGQIRKSFNDWSTTPPVHENCNCFIDYIETIKAGSATIKGYLGADIYLKEYKQLPNNYITQEKAFLLGWTKNKGNLHIVAKGKIIGGDLFRNREQKLPVADGREWYEADINYKQGYRNSHRLLYSNDGLIFVTYDHYNTFFEIN